MREWSRKNKNSIREKAIAKRATSEYKEAYKKYRESEKFKITYLAGHLRRKYGITLEQYLAKLEEQNGLCKICGGTDKREWRDGRVQRLPLCVDHNHKTGKVRGLLCNHCNVGLALFKEHPEFLLAAISYLGMSN